MNESQRQELSFLIDKYSETDIVSGTSLPELCVMKSETRRIKSSAVYVPSLCLIVQGRKEIMLENELYSYSPSEYLAVSVELPIVGQVTEASREKPYLGLSIAIDPVVISEMLPYAPEEGTTSRGLFVGRTDEGLADCILRLVRLLDTPEDAAFMSPLILRELYYRLLKSPHGWNLAQIAVAGSSMQRIAKVIKTLKTDFARNMRIEEMAEMANMSQSSFHHHFKEVTAMSPLQFQKRLRLTEARRIMLTESADASSTAFRVGYESASQFSREYSRMFGAPPVSDIASLRRSTAAEAVPK
ncbi:AraC family transcriptional regulator [Geovibrio thiophilus]|uniref:AraC family transcriptional regulator n=1 Tax=Geovibrio thiophilus TaxID=139438 RepID=A0A3R5Z0Y5_9BACT|nr:AraC family transcriptional regulator [Geovibrio thiophilus]QAR34298.1 AraC family transcriptional regulator [Geovibrio thiophilus]